jgi:hypothetical protein
MLFTFAGSTHTKYATYLLELITNFELESSQELRETVLNAMVVNLSGKEGGFAAGDIIQEFFNRLLEAIIERKGAQFGEPFVRNVISRNLHHMGRVKTDLRSSIGLSARSGRHSDPHTRPEVKTLLEVYADHELHSRRPGRSIDGEEVADDFACGWERLAKGKIRKWVAETTRVRAMRTQASGFAEKSESSVEGSDILGVEEGDEEDYEEEGEVEDTTATSTFGSMSFIDGDFVIETLDSDEMVKQLMDDLDGDGDENESDTGADADELEITLLE